MDVNSNFAAQLYGQAQTASRPEVRTIEQQRDAGAFFADAVRSFAETVQHGENMAHAAMTTGADPHALVTALAQTELAVETAVTVRDRVVEAYQEILRMPV